jgi:hypothetical protein
MFLSRCVDRQNPPYVSGNPHRTTPTGRAFACTVLTGVAAGSGSPRGSAHGTADVGQEHDRGKPEQVRDAAPRRSNPSHRLRSSLIWEQARDARLEARRRRCPMLRSIFCVTRTQSGSCQAARHEEEVRHPLRALITDSEQAAIAGQPMAA